MAGKPIMAAGVYPYAITSQTIKLLMLHDGGQGTPKQDDLLEAAKQQGYTLEITASTTPVDNLKTFTAVLCTV